MGGKAKFPDQHLTSVSEAAMAAIAASASDMEEESGPKWRPEETFDSKVALEMISSQNMLSGAGSDDLRLSHVRSIIRMDLWARNVRRWC